MQKPKLAFVGNSSRTMANFRIGLLKALSEKYDITVIALKDSDITIYEKNNIKFIDVYVDSKGLNPIKDLKFIFCLRDIYLKEKFDFIFHYTIKPVIYGSFAAILANKAHISVITGLGYTFIKEGLINKITILLYRLSLKKAKEVWFLNNDDLEMFLRKKIVSKKKTKLLNGEGIDMELFQPQKKKSKNFSFIFIGRVLWDKGVGEYIQACKILKSKYPEIKFEILGPLGAENPAAIKPEQMNVWVNEMFVDYLGETTDVIPYISNSDCIVLPSYREGLSRILLEAAAMERPIIASNVAGCKEVVEDNVSGFLCNPKDAVNLAACMEKIYLLEAEERQKMGKRGREIVLEKFEEKIIIENYLKILKQYLDI